MISLSQTEFSRFAEQAKCYAAARNPCAILDSCEITPQCNRGQYKLLLGFGGNRIIEPNQHALEVLYQNVAHSGKWAFGCLSYDLKNEIENLTSDRDKAFQWPLLSFFVPEVVLTVNWQNELQVYGADLQTTYQTIRSYQIPEETETPPHLNEFRQDLTPGLHHQRVTEIKEQILNGNVYELNLCSRFLYNQAQVKDPYLLFRNLSKLSPSPFSAYFKSGHKHVLCASPERYVQKSENVLISQPIKGTRPRSNDPVTDAQLKQSLKTNLKDRAENVMIVDLVRNDLAKISLPGTVKVNELFGIYSYSHVHQMVTTVTGHMEHKYNWKDALFHTFPMGSMTGTPKIAAMKWIEEFELSAREWYAGALGYIDPNGNFDFNVLIRSIFYDSHLQRLAYYAGGAITIDSDEHAEYMEMMTKVKAIQSLLNRDTW